MSEISIIRFRPAAVAHDKITAVHPGKDENKEKNQPGGSSRGQLPHSDSQDEDHEASEAESQEEGFDDDRGGNAQSADSVSADDEVTAAVEKLNDYVQTVQRDMFFGVSHETGDTLVTVVDRKSKKMVRQFAGKEAVELAKKLETQEQLTLFSAEV